MAEQIRLLEVVELAVVVVELLLLVHQEVVELAVLVELEQQHLLMHLL